MSDASDVGSVATSWRDDPGWPDVDVVMPIRNEAPHLGDALAAVRGQAYPGRLRVFLGVGPSDDGTEAAAAALAAGDDDVVVVDNPSGTTPAALNVAIRAGSAPVIVRVDGHSQPCGGYVERAVATLRRTGAANVGGRQVPVPTTPFQEAVAVATTSWMGTGGASYRVGGGESDVDTVYLGVFDRQAIEAVGLFDERLIRNQDYELNIRLRKSGGRVVFDPELWVGYTPRSSWRALARQYYEYGQWKAVVMRMHPDSIKLRQLIPPVVVTAVTVASVSAAHRRVLGVLPLLYVGATLTAVRLRWQAAVAIVTIHGAWTAGLISRSVRTAIRRWEDDPSA